MLSFKEFQALNRKRCEEAFHLVGDEKAWSFDKWCLALAGEVGELCNCVKKALRGDYKLEDRREEILAELADIITYADLAISHLGADTEDVLMAKFVEVSGRVGWEHKPTTELMNTMGDVDNLIEENGELVSEQLAYFSSMGLCITERGGTCRPFDAIPHIRKLETALLKAKSRENEEKTIVTPIRHSVYDLMCVCGHPKSKHGQSVDGKPLACVHSWAHDHLTHWCTCNNFQAAE